MSRSEFRAASYWQFLEQLDGWLSAHVPDRKEGLSSDDEAALFDLASMATE